MPDKKVYNKPSTGYNIVVKIADLDYTNDLLNVRIVSSFVGAYQIVTLDMLLDQSDVILEKIYGKEPIKMTIKYIGRGSVHFNTEQVEFELIHLSSNSQVGIKRTNPIDKNRELIQVSFVTVPRKPFKTVTTLVNDVFIAKQPKDIISELVSKNTDCQLVYDSDEINTDPIEQLIIPPTPLYNIIRYIDDNFGLFKGASNIGFCQYDNKLNIMNLTKRITKAPVFTIYQLSQDGEDTSKIIADCNDGTKFYTYSNLVSKYSGNTKFAYIAKNIKNIVKPKDKLFHTVEQNLETVCKNFGLNMKNPDLNKDSILDSRETYKTTSAGNETSEHYANAKIARSIISLATIIVTLEKDLPIINLLKVGEPVNLITKTIDYLDLSGKYLLKSSDLVFAKTSVRDWMSYATLNLCRTNKTI